MLFDFIAAIAAGFGAAGIAMLTRRIIRGAPRFIIPAAAGIGMLAVTIYNEYAWFPQTSGQLPDGFAVVSTRAEPAFYRPWTYAEPFVSRFSALDLAGALRNEDAPGLLLAEIYIFERHTETQTVRVVIDCAEQRHGPLRGADWAADGVITPTAWAEGGPEDPLIRAACPRPEGTG